MSPPLDISGITAAGDLTETVILTGPDGMTASILTLGARLIDLRLPNGRPLVLTYETLEQVEADDASINIPVGRVANRIHLGQSTVHPALYPVPLELNDSGVNHLHGGSNSWDKRLYTVSTRTPSSVTLTRLSPHGEQRHPSAVDVAVTYELQGDGRLAVTFVTKNVGDRLTQTNMTLHPYFDLTGRNGTVENSVIPYTAYAPTCESYLPLDESNAPTGQIAPVAGTRFDFREERTLGDANGPGEFTGYDQFLVAREGPCAPAAEGQGDLLLTVGAPAGEWGEGVQMQVITDQPGLQVYTANGMDGSGVRGFAKFGSIAVEPSEFVDAGNHAGFPQVTLAPGEERVQNMTYRFSVV